MKVRIKFSKQGTMKFIGHLDVMRYFQKAMRRADIDIAFSEGFSPHMIMSFALPLGVGMTGSGEYMDIEVRTPISSKEALARLNAVMAEGMCVKSFRRIEEGKASNAMSLVAAADYTVCFREGACPPAGWQEQIPGFLAKPAIPVCKKTKTQEKEEDIRPLIYQMEARGDSLFLRLAAGSAANLKPELLLLAFASYLGWEMPPSALQINREELYADVGDGAGTLLSLEELGEEIDDA